MALGGHEIAGRRVNMKTMTSVPGTGQPETTLRIEVLRLLDRLKLQVLERVTDQEAVRGILVALAEQQEMFVSVVDLMKAPNASGIEVEIIRQCIRMAGFVAGVISCFPQATDGPRDHEATWHHVHTTILDGLDDRPENLVDTSLLAVLEVARGEVSEAYRLVRPHPEEKLPRDCRLFFDGLDLGSALLAAHLGCRHASPRSGEDFESTCRSKYSGDKERYPIDIRTCVLNDIRRYFPGQSITVSERVFQAVQATYVDSIAQLCPEDVGLFSGLLLATPSLVFALKDDDFSPEAFVDANASIAPNDHPTWGYAWTVSLSRMFFNDDGKPTDVASRTMASKNFGVFELLDGILVSMEKPWGHSIQSEFFQKCREASVRFASGRANANDVVSNIKRRSRISQTIDPSFAWQQFGIYLDGDNRAKAVAFCPWNLSRLSDGTDENQEHRLFRANLAQPAGSLSRDVLNELEWLIAQDLPEAAFQRFLERNPSVLLGLGPYHQAVPHVILHEDDGQKLIPDFFLEIADRRGVDILELKLPASRIAVRQARRERFRSALHQAVAQLRTYRDWFRSAEHRRRFTSDTGMTSFRPRAIVVFGRSMDFQSHVDRQRLEVTLPEWVRLVTYDDLLLSAREWMLRIRASERTNART
jgi:hypothetical protein